MKYFVLLFIIISTQISFAQAKMKMNFTNLEITKIIEDYSKASGQKFIVDPGVRGRISIFVQEAVTLEEAFNHLSSALAVNGFAMSKQGDTIVVKAARNIQRDLIEVSTVRPTLKPERMYSWVYTVKNFTAEQISKDFRIITSKDGEMNLSTNTNQLIITDWTSNLNRIADLFEEIDKKVDPSTAKLVELSQKQREMRMKDAAQKKNENDKN